MARSRALAVRRRRSVRRFFRARRRTHTGFKIPLAIVAGMIPVGVGIWNRRNSPSEIATYLQEGFTGIGEDGTFNLANFRKGLLPVGAGFIAHMVASKLGVNRAIAKSGLPFIRI